MKHIHHIHYPERCYWLTHPHPAKWRRSLSGAQSRAVDGKVLLGLVIKPGEWEREVETGYAGEDRYVEADYLGTNHWGHLVVDTGYLEMSIPASYLRGPILVSYEAKRRDA